MKNPRLGWRPSKARKEREKEKKRITGKEPLQPKRRGGGGKPSI